MLKFQRLLIALFILSIPIIYPLHNVDNSRVFQEAVFQYGVMILAVFFVRNLWLALFFCWTLFLYYLNGHDSVGHDTVLNVFLGVILYGISRQIYSKFKFEKECRWILYVGLTSLVFMGFQYFHIDPLHSFQDGAGVIDPFKSFCDLTGIFALKAHNGIYLALLVPILATIHPLLALLMFLPIKTSQSSAAVLAGASSLLFFLWFTKQKRWFFASLALGIIGMGYFFFQDFEFSPGMYESRFNIWHLTLKESLLRPIGYGPDSYRNTTPYKDFLIMGDQDFHAAIGVKTPDPNNFQFIYYDPDNGKLKQINDKEKGYKLTQYNAWDHPHNEYLNLLFCWGFPGVVIIYLLFREKVKQFIGSVKSRETVLIASLILIYVISSFTQFPLCVARIGYLFPILLGAFDASVEI